MRKSENVDGSRVYEKTKFKIQDAESLKNFEVVFHPVKIETVSFLGGSVHGFSS